MSAEMNWDQLRIFLAAQRAGSLRGASDALGVNHATIKRGVEALEKSLGTRLFDRSSSGLSLTQPGEVLVQHALEMERQTEQIARRLSGLDSKPDGLIRISIPPAFTTKFLAPLLAGFSRAYPDIDVKIIATNQISNLARQEADISLRTAYEVDDDVVGRKLVRYVLGVFATQDYLDNVPKLIVGDGTGATWIGWSENRNWLKDSPYPNANVRHAQPSVTTQIEYAAEHMGMVWIPAVLGDMDDRLVRVPNAPVTENRYIWLLLHGDLRKTARVRAFVDFAADYILANRKAFIS